MSLLYRLWCRLAGWRCECGTWATDMAGHRALEHAGDEWTGRRG